MTGSGDLEGSEMTLIQYVDSISGWENLDRGCSRYGYLLFPSADVILRADMGIAWT